MTDLKPGLPPDEVEKMRWQAFGQKRACMLKSADELVLFVERRGIVLLGPAPGLHYPSAVEAAVGRPLLEFVQDERSAQVRVWFETLVKANKLARGALQDRFEAALAPAIVVDVLAAGAGRPLDAALRALAEARPKDAKKALKTDPAQARARLAARVLQNVLVVASHELARLFAWREADASLALRAVVESGEAALHPASRPRRETFQTRATHLLDEV